MVRVNASMPEDLHQRAQRAGLNISRLAQQAIASELERPSRIEALDAYLAELESHLGPISEAERTDASDWADRVLGKTSQQQPA